MSNKKQTAVEWLEEKAKEFAIDLDLLRYFQQAKEMEKQQIIDAYQNKRYIDYPYPMQEAKIYYKETFKQL
jgi:hypothetical protein